MSDEYTFHVDQAVLYQNEVWYVLWRHDWNGEPWYVVRKRSYIRDETMHVHGGLLTSLEEAYRKEVNDRENLKRKMFRFLTALDEIFEVLQHVDLTVSVTTLAALFNMRSIIEGITEDESEETE